MARNILLIDNYDSFTYNLVQYLGEVSPSSAIEVFRNDEITLDQITARSPDYIVISPGPCTPDVAGISIPVVKALSGKIPILGVCLGHQAIGEAFGGKVIRAQRPVHGKVSRVSHDGQGIFSAIEDPFVATRYHSLVVERESLPKELEVTAWTEEGEIMGLRVRSHPSTIGVQFHPESILTLVGKRLLGNFLAC